MCPAAASQMTRQCTPSVSSVPNQAAGRIYAYYAREIHEHANPRELNFPGYRAEVWCAAPWRILPACLVRPRGDDGLLRLGHLFFYWLHHYFALFGRDREYRILLIFRDRELAHYSIVRSRDFRFPFMGPGDLQVGPVWTHPKYRRRGLAKRALALICSRWSGAHRRIWWLCSGDNSISELVARSQEFAPVGTGDRRKIFGLRQFGSFHIDRYYSG